MIKSGDFLDIGKKVHDSAVAVAPNTIEGFFKGAVAGVFITRHPAFALGGGIIGGTVGYCKDIGVTLDDLNRICRGGF